MSLRHQRKQAAYEEKRRRWARQLELDAAFAQLKGEPQSMPELVDTAGKPLIMSRPGQSPSGRTHKVQVMQDHTLHYPQMFLDVHVVGDMMEQRAFAHMFVRSACKKAESIAKADLVVFTGGVDVDPQLYGEERHYSTSISVKRDNDDIEAYLTCYNLGIPMLGVCRGAQFLHVMQGGKLFQDVDNHNGPHSMYDVRGHKMIEKISSVHHQMVIPDVRLGIEILGTSGGQSKVRKRNPRETETGHATDTEAFFYRDVCVIGVQGHPEYAGYNYFTKWTLDVINELVCNNPDIIREVGGNLRLKPDILGLRPLRVQPEPKVLAS